MNRNFISSVTGLFILTLAVGCRVTMPTPLADVNASALAEPISYYGDIELFDEKSTPLSVKVAAPASSDDISLIETLKDAVNKSDVNCTAFDKPCDIQIYINSAYQELTPAPQCRLSNSIAISVAAPDGTMLLPIWQHKTQNMQAYSTAADAKNKLRPVINETILAWEKNNFRREVVKNLNVSIVRFKMSRRLIELDPIRFEKDLRLIINKLRKLAGCIDVRTIEANKETRIVSFRILHRNGLCVKDEINKQK